MPTEDGPGLITVILLLARLFAFLDMTLGPANPSRIKFMRHIPSLRQKCYKIVNRNKKGPDAVRRVNDQKACQP
jgi:hypothetical protein